MTLKKVRMNYRETLVQRLAVLKSCVILDAGTGAGSMTKALSDGSRLSMVSVDVNRQVFPYVLEKINRNRIEFVACDFAHMPFRENVFCAIVCDLVISTSREWKPLSVYSEFRRVLKSKSPLFITDYYPEKPPRTREALLAKQTSRLYGTVSRLKGVEVPKSVPPESSVKQLKKTGFTAVRKEKIRANEAQEWKKRVFEEYFHGMEMEISGLKDSRLKNKFTKRLTQLKNEIDSSGGIRWGWGANYIIEATK